MTYIPIRAVTLFSPAFPKLYCTLKSEPPTGRNTAALSTGRSFKARRIKSDPDKYLSSRARFKRNGSGSAKQALRKASGREKQHLEQINDEISRFIIEDAAERNIRLIVLEDLTDIRKRIKAGQKVRARLHRWPSGFLKKASANRAIKKKKTSAIANRLTPLPREFIRD